MASTVVEEVVQISFNVETMENGEDREEDMPNEAAPNTTKKKKKKKKKKKGE